MNRFQKNTLILFAVRHGLGAALFLYLSLRAHRIGGGPIWMAIPLLGLVYVSFAAFSWIRMRRLFRKQARVKQEPDAVTAN